MTARRAQAGTLTHIDMRFPDIWTYRGNTTLRHSAGKGLKSGAVHKPGTFLSINSIQDCVFIYIYTDSQSKLNLEGARPWEGHAVAPKANLWGLWLRSTDNLTLIDCFYHGPKEINERETGSQASSTQQKLKGLADMLSKIFISVRACSGRL